MSLLEIILDLKHWCYRRFDARKFKLGHYRMSGLLASRNKRL